MRAYEDNVAERRDLRSDDSNNDGISVTRNNREVIRNDVPGIYYWVNACNVMESLSEDL